MLKNKRFVVSLIIVLSVILLAGVLTLALKNFNKGTPQVAVLNPSGTISSPSPMKIEGSTTVLTTTQTIPSTTPTASEKIDQAIDINKFSNLVKNSYNSSIKEKMVEDLKDTINEYAKPGYRITSFSVGDVNNDNRHELVITYAYPYDDSIKEWDYSLDITKKYEEQGTYLCVYGFDSGTLNMFDRTTIPVISTVFITDLVPDKKKEIFVMDKHMDVLGKC